MRMFTQRMKEKRSCVGVSGARRGVMGIKGG